MKTILVTGGNRGIGLEICKQLHHLGHTIIMGTRDTARGVEAARSADIDVQVFPLDVTDEQSIIALKSRVDRNFGKLDVLINNAGLGSTHFNSNNSAARTGRDILRMSGKTGKKIKELIKPVLKRTGFISNDDNVKSIDMDRVRHIMDTNLYGPWMMISHFIPLLEKSDDARIINISSGMGALESLDGEYPAYRMSKVSLNALTIMFARELEVKKIVVNAMCPGWVRTDMGGPDAPRQVNQGADTAVWLATERIGETGKFYRDREIIPW